MYDPPVRLPHIVDLLTLYDYTHTVQNMFFICRDIIHGCTPHLITYPTIHANRSLYNQNKLTSCHGCPFGTHCRLSRMKAHNAHLSHKQWLVFQLPHLISM